MANHPNRKKARPSKQTMALTRDDWARVRDALESFTRPEYRSLAERISRMKIMQD